MMVMWEKSVIGCPRPLGKMVKSNLLRKAPLEAGQGFFVLSKTFLAHVIFWELIHVKSRVVLACFIKGFNLYVGLLLGLGFKHI